MRLKNQDSTASVDRVKQKMISVKKLLIILIISLLTFTPWSLWAAMALMGFEPGDPAPDFQIRTIDNQEITLSDLKGKIIILAFWKRDQDYSEKTLADLERVYQEYRDRGVTVLALNGDKASEPEIRSIGTTQTLNYPLASDPELDVYGRFGVMVLPTTLVIGPEGKLVYHRSVHTKDFYQQFRGQVRVLLGEITRAQLEAELNPQKMQEKSAARKKATRYLNLGRMLMELNYQDKARVELEKAVEAEPSLAEPHLLLAKIHLEDKEVSKARAELEQVLKLNPGSKEGKLLQGLTYARQGEDRLAISVLQELVENNPEPPPEAYYQIGKIYQKQNKTPEALEAYQVALDLLLGE